MREFNLATCRSRTNKTYLNKMVSWEAFLDRLKEPVRTYETVQEYKLMPKAKQADIKDVGGFVAGSLKNGTRNNQSVLTRSMITLDVDFADQDFWAEVQLDADYAVAIYSTHKHTPEYPKYRLIIPLSRDVDPDEYEAVARMIANTWNMDYFDDTTYQPARMMFWPSVSKDGVYFFEYLDGEYLDPDKVLSEYDDWHDTSFWPRSTRVMELHRKSAAKQGDPLIKEGLIGAFCRTYDIHRAISTFLPEVYTPTEKPDRYTYSKGSTAGGLVLYEDKFAYSNHATDPISGHLCNAFDLVRIHKFHTLDADCAPDTPANKRPSWEKMMELCATDEAVKKLHHKERMEQALTEFDDFEDYMEENDEWLSKLDTDKKGNIKATTDNIVIILENDPHLKKNIGGFDEFNQRPVKFGDLPWAKLDQTNPNWSDEDDAGLRYYLEKLFGIVAKGKIDDAITVVHQRHSFHPVRDYLKGLKWDEQPRLDTLFIDFLGAEDSPYIRAVTRKSLTAAVKRIMQPGCKYDYIPVLIGRQGIGKSQILNKLGGKWFSDTITTVSGKEAYEALHGSWIIEMSELAATRKSDIEQTKQFITKQSDRYRKAYARRVTDNPRQCVFFGTTNDDEFLRDYTGNRRYWPIDTEIQDPKYTVFKDFDENYRDQVWAEAVYSYKQDEVIFLPPELEEVALEMQDRFTYKSVREDVIANYIDRLVPDNWYEMNTLERQLWLDDEKNIGELRRDKFCLMELWIEALGGDRRNFSNVDQRELANIMRKLGWVRSKNPVRWGDIYGRVRVYERPKLGLI